MIFHEITISALGHSANSRKVDSGKLSPEAIGWLTGLLETHGSEFRAEIPLKGVRRFELQWSSEHLSSALATFYQENQVNSTVVLVCGIDEESDRLALSRAQATVQRMCAAVGESAGRGLLEFKERPAIALIPWSAGRAKGQDLMLDMQTCLAAAFFLRSYRNRAAAL